MPIREILRAVIFLNRTADKKDFNEVVNCIPDERMNVLGAGLIQRENAGEINTVQIGRYRMQAANFTDYVDEVDKFFAKIDGIKGLHSSMDRATASEAEDPGSIPGEVTTHISEIRHSENEFTGFDDVEETNPRM